MREVQTTSKEEIFDPEGGETLAQVVQQDDICPIPGNLAGLLVGALSIMLYLKVSLLSTGQV